MSDIDQRFDAGLAEPEHCARRVTSLEGEERYGCDVWKLADEPRDGAELLFPAPCDRQYDGTRALIAEIIEHVIE